MKSLLLVLALAGSAGAHVVSMSTGVATVEGRTLRYQLRMPLYETQHMRDPATVLFEHISFRSGGAAGRLLDKNCRAEQDSWVCDARFEFPSDIDKLDVTCTFPELGIPTHVHLLRAVNGPNSAQAAFDAAFIRSELSFRPPTAAEEAARQTAAGFLEAAKEPGVLLLIAMLALACRSWREVALLGGALLAGQAIACVLIPFTGWLPTLRFAEAAAALAAAYCAFEVFLSPGGGLGWYLMLVLGALESLRLRYLLHSLDYPPGWFLAGAFVAQGLLLVVLFPAAGRMRRWRTGLRVLASAGGLAGLAWFAVQL